MARNRVFDSISGFFGDVGRARNAFDTAFNGK